jgi:hypothetical protein
MRGPSSVCVAVMMLSAVSHTARAFSRVPLARRAFRLASTSTDLTQEGGNLVHDNTRRSRGDLSLDTRTIASDLPTVLSHLQARSASSDTSEAAEQIANLSEDRVKLIQERDGFLNQRKEASAVVGKLMRNKDNLDSSQQEELEEAKSASTAASEKATNAEAALEEIQTTMDRLLAGIPNLLDDQVPFGRDESENEEVSRWGDKDALPARLEWDDSFQPLWHDDVASNLNGYQVEAAVKMSGARFVALSGSIAQLERAIAMFCIDLHTTQHGYTEVSVPFVVGRSALEGTSQLPKFQEDLFAITPESHTCNGEDAFLIPTAEVPVTNMHRGQVLEESDLPLSYVLDSLLSRRSRKLRSGYQRFNSNAPVPKGGTGQNHNGRHVRCGTRNADGARGSSPAVVGIAVPQSTFVLRRYWIFSPTLLRLGGVVARGW